MALPVEQIMSQLQRGDYEDIEEDDDIAEGPELEEELGNEELFKEAGRGVTPILEMPIFESTFYCNPTPIIFFMFSLE